MQRGEALTYQCLLSHDDWVGRPDCLSRVDAPSSLGVHS